MFNVRLIRVIKKHMENVMQQNVKVLLLAVLRNLSKFFFSK